MADVLHSSLTGADLHECKGASTASLGQVPVATGSGTAVFSNLSWNYITGKPAIPTTYYGGVTVSAPVVQHFQVSAVAGSWSISMSAFSTIHSVQVTAVSAGTGTSSVMATLNSYSTTAASGEIISLDGTNAKATSSTATVFVTVSGV